MSRTLRRIVAIAVANLVRTFRDRTGLFFVLVLPLIIVVAVGLQFGGAGAARLGVIAPAGDPMAEALVASIAEGDLRVEVRRYTEEATLRAAVERGQLELGLIVPADYAIRLTGTAGDAATIGYLGTPDALTAGLRPAIEAAIAGQARIVVAARVASTFGGGSYGDALVAARAADEASAVPGVEVVVERTGEPSPFEGFGQFTLGAQTQLVMFVFLTSVTAAAQLVLTKRLGVARRMLSTPTPIGVILVGEAVGRYLVALVQGAFIFLVTAVAFAVDWGDPVAAVLLVAAFSLVGAGVAMLMGAVATNAEQAGSVGVFLSLALAALGGCMVPITFMPEAMQQFARFTPHFWALEGFGRLVTVDATVAGVLGNLGVLVAYGTILLIIAAWRLRRSLVH